LAISRDKQCDNNYGGISEIYVFEFNKIPRSQIKVVDNILTLFPYTIIYNLNANQVNFSEPVDEEGGGVVYTQSGSFQLKKILNTDNYKQFVAKDWRIIIKDNNGYYRLIGLETGVKIKFTKDTGTNLADFNGFKFSFETKEENTAPFLNNLNGFSINDFPLWVDDNIDFIVDTNDNKIEVII